MLTPGGNAELLAPVRRTNNKLFYGSALLLILMIGPVLAWPALRALVLNSSYLPHRYCYLAQPGLVWTHVSADMLIGLAYVAISFTLAFMVYKGRRDIPFHWMFLAFGLFIVACGGTHFVETLTVWVPVYVFSAGVKIFTALASISTALILPFTVPRVLSLVQKAKVSEEMTARLLQSEEELRLQNAQLEAANKELEAFSYSVSHDLRAPLRSIDGFSQSLLEDCGEKLDSTDRDHLNRVRAAAGRMASLIDDLLNLSRITRSEMKRETVDLSAVAHSIVADLQKTDDKRQVQFHIQDGVTAEGDPHLFRVMLQNLLDNSWKFTSKHPTAHIEFGCKSLGNGPTYFVSDDGAGFDPSYTGRLFGAFQRLHGVTEFPGTGIGLATVQRIVHRHGGRVWAEGAVEKGATFYFAF